VNRGLSFLLPRSLVKQQRWHPACNNCSAIIFQAFSWRNFPVLLQKLPSKFFEKIIAFYLEI